MDARDGYGIDFRAFKADRAIFALVRIGISVITGTAATRIAGKIARRIYGGARG